MASTDSDDDSDTAQLLDVELGLARSAEPFRTARIVVVDDDASSVHLLTTVLAMAGATDVHGITDPRQVVTTCQRLRPDLLLLDLHMGLVDGQEILDDLGPAIAEHLAVIVLTGDTHPEVKKRALATGATGFIAKPFDLVELVHRVRTLLEARALHDTFR